MWTAVLADEGVNLALDVNSMAFSYSEESCRV